MLRGGWLAVLIVAATSACADSAPSPAAGSAGTRAGGGGGVGVAAGAGAGDAAGAGASAGGAGSAGSAGDEVDPGPEVVCEGDYEIASQAQAESALAALAQCTRVTGSIRIRQEAMLTS